MNLPKNRQALFFRFFDGARIEALSAKTNNRTRRIGLALAVLRVFYSSWKKKKAMSNWIDPRFHIACFSDDKHTTESFRIQGGKLHNLQVHDLHETGERLVWLDEVGEISTSKILARLKVKYRDLAKIDPEIAWRAKLTSSDDPEEELEALRQNKQTPDPEWVWLGVQRCRQAKWSKDDPDLPQWALGVGIVEAEENYGDFGIVGYTTPSGEQFWQWAKDYYIELLITKNHC
jgi:hypothetical protein